MPGEYEYIMKDGDTVVSTGVLIIGKYGTDIDGQYNKTIEYEQYNGQ